VALKEEKKMEKHRHNLNIHYEDLKFAWHKLEELYEHMPCWNGYVEGRPTWYGQGDGRLVDITIESRSLQLYAELPEEEWNIWFSLFSSRVSKILGYQVTELKK
jgi:hypothetical protein